MARRTSLITSAANPRVKLVRKLASRRQRDKLALFACEGEDLVTAAIAAGIEPVDAFVDAERPPAVDGLGNAELVSSDVMGELSTLGHPPRVLAVFRRADLPSGVEPPVGLALWRVADPGNVGTLVRAADALGPAFVALSAGCADPTSPKALRASMGAVFRVPLARFDDAPRPTIGLTPRARSALADVELGERATFVLGGEREGLPADVLERCDEQAAIPLAAGAESLNVAMAGTVALYEVRRRR